MSINTRIIRKADIVAGVPDRWAKQYQGYMGSFAGYRDKQEIARELQAIKGSDFTAQQVNAIIGNDSWTQSRCDGCDEDCELLVRIGETPEYEARWLDLCLSCVRSAFDAIGRADVNTAHNKNKSEEV